jgi:DNA processing protein
VTPARERDWLRLARTENVGPVTFQQLIKRFGTAGAALDALPALARQGGRPSSLAIPSTDAIEAELAAGAALGGRLLTGASPAFPAQLAALDPPPPVIWALGDADLLARPAVAVVGARIASAAGQRFARGLAHDLGAAGYVVVSGMARGIDAAAHEGSLRTGSVAVLGGGPDDIYPSEHRDLHRRLV